MCRAQCVLVVALLVGLVHSWDFATTVGNRLEFYTDNGTKLATVSLTFQTMAAIAYDEVNNILLYVNKQNSNDAICGYNINSMEHKCFTERNGRNIQGLAVDPISEILFFTDTKRRSINWISLKPGYKNYVYEYLLIKMDVGIPTDIAVDSCRGYIYWINTNLPTSTIERARFNGSNREVVINSKYNRNLHNLAIDLQTQKIYWTMPETKSSKSYTCSADLNGKNVQEELIWTGYPSSSVTNPNSFTVSKQNLYVVAISQHQEGISGFFGHSSIKKVVWKFQKSPLGQTMNKMFEVHNESGVGIAANYKMKDQFQGISNCPHVLKNYKTDKIAREYYFGPYCVHGIKVNGQSQCICSPGYTGERCEVSSCENYCLQGKCSLSEGGLPKCRCEAGYSGERCEVNVCHGHCLNSGICSLNEEEGPVCECMGEYEGERCEVPGGLNNGNSFPLEEHEPACQCVGSHERSGRVNDNKNSTSTLNYFEKRHKRNLS